MVVVEQLVDPQESGRVGPASASIRRPSSVGVLATDRDPTGRRPQGGCDHVSSAGVALVVAQERPGEQREELGQQWLSPLVIRERSRKQGSSKKARLSAVLIWGRSSGLPYGPYRRPLCKPPSIGLHGRAELSALVGRPRGTWVDAPVTAVWLPGRRAAVYSQREPLPIQWLPVV